MAGTQLIVRVASILNSLASSPDGVNLVTVAREVGLAKSTTRRILQALCEEGLMVQPQPHKEYRPGPRLISLATQIVGKLDLRQEARPLMVDLATRLGTNVFLAAMVEDDVICLETIEQSRGIRFFVEIGKRLPLNTSAAAQAIVAHMPEVDRTRLLEQVELRTYTERTVRTRSELESRLTEARRRGFAISDEEHETGVRAVAVPVWGTSGRPTAALAVIGTLQYFAGKPLEGIVDACVATAGAISARLGVEMDGYRPVVQRWRRGRSVIGPNQTILFRLETQLDSLPRLLDEVSPEALLVRPRSGKCSAHENLAHLARYHEVFLTRLQRILEEERPQLPRYRAEEDPEAARWVCLPPPTVIEQLGRLRAALLDAVKRLMASDWLRVGVHPTFGPMPLSLWLDFFLVHEAHHLYVAFQCAREVAPPT